MTTDTESRPMEPCSRDIERIVAAAARAPSGDNCQPWRFGWDGRTLEVLHDAARAEHPLDAGWIGSDLSLGCVLESVEIAADAVGFVAKATVHTADPRRACWATVRFQPGSSGRARLLRALERRTTDRRLYRTGSIDHPVFARVRAASSDPRCRVHVIAPPTGALLEFFVAIDAFVLHTPSVYEGTARWLRITQREVEQTRDGVSWRTLGFDLPELRALRFMRAPTARAVARALGGTAVTALWLRRQLASSTAVVLLTTRASTSDRVVAVGRAAMTAWLELTEADHGVQPLSLQSALILAEATGTLPPDTAPAFPPLLRRGRQLLAQQLGLADDELPVWMFRVGPSSSLPEHRRTLRLRLDQILTTSASPGDEQQR